MFRNLAHCSQESHIKFAGLPQKLSKKAETLDLVMKDNPKAIHPGFPYETWKVAMSRVKVLEFNEISTHPATAVPRIVEWLKNHASDEAGQKSKNSNP